MRSRQRISSDQRVLQPENPPARLPDSKFLRALGTDVYTAPSQTSASSLRAAEEWERCICENQAFSILHQAQEGRQELIKKDGGEMLVSMVLDRPLDEAEALVEDLDRLISEITAILESKQAHPLLDQMVNPDVRDDMPIADFTVAASSRGFGPPRRPHKQKYHNLGFSSVILASLNWCPVVYRNCTADMTEQLWVSS